MATAADINRDVLGRFWAALYRQDYPALVALFHPDGRYTDACTPADDVAVGGAEITARLRLAFDRLDRLWDEPGLTVAGDDAVMTEHVEHWAWPTGETMALQVASVHELVDGRITRWTDYWDMGALVAVAPAWWIEHVMGGWKT